MQTQLFDVIIIGAGPAGLAAALQLAPFNLKTTIIDIGPDLEERFLIKSNNKERPYGFGGSGFRNDGKFIFSSKTGGWLSDIIPPEKLNHYFNLGKKYLENLFVGLPVNVYHGKDIINFTANSSLQSIVYEIWHVGSDILPEVLRRIKSNLIENNIQLKMNERVIYIEYEKDRMPTPWKISTSIDTYYSKKVIVAPGRAESKWLQKQISMLDIPSTPLPIDIGVRVEIPYSVTEHITSINHEFKLIYTTPSYNDKVRTFCVSPGGYVVQEQHSSYTLVNGYSNSQDKSKNTNFALLCSIPLGPPQQKPIELSEHIIKTTNLLSGGILVQRLEDLLLCRRTHSLDNNSVRPTLPTAAPGDISLAYPHRIIINIIEAIQALDTIANGIANSDTLLYAPEIKLYNMQIQTDENMQTNIEGLYCCGDGAGISRGIVQAFISGLIAADNIINNTT